MLATGVTYGVMLATLVVVAAYAIIASRTMHVNSVKNFLRCVCTCVYVCVYETVTDTVPLLLTTHDLDPPAPRTR